jgi:hypothetical protein
MIIDLSELFESLKRIESKIDTILESKTLEAPEKPQDSIISLPPPPIEVGMERIDISDTFKGNNDIKLESGKHYWAGHIFRQTLLNRDVKIYSDSPENRPILEFGVENYDPHKNGKQDGELFWIHDNSTLVIQNVDICQSPQIQTVQTFNPKILSSASVDNIKWTAIIQNCDTTRLGNNGGFGIGTIAGSKLENHLALLNFKHWGSGLIDAKNPYQDGVMYVTMRDVDAYLGYDARISPTSFRHTGSLKDNVIEFDGSVYSLTAGYNFTWRDNFSYVMLWDRFTFFIDGYKNDTVVSENKFRLRPQPKGKVTFGVLSASEIFSNEYEMHAGDKLKIGNTVYTVTEKNRLPYPEFDSRTGRDQKFARAIKYTLDKTLPFEMESVEIEYLSPQIEFKDHDITFSYLNNNGFLTDLNTTYRQSNLLKSRGIGHLSYSHSSISMDAQNVKHLGPYRGSKSGTGKSLIWNLYNVEGMEEHDWFQSDLPVTHVPNLPLHKRIQELLWHH